MERYKVSVIIPIYNVEEYLEECLQSVVDQTLGRICRSSWLMMVLWMEVQTFCSRNLLVDDMIIFMYDMVNGGLGNAMKYRSEVCKGKYIIFLDSDDIVPDDAYEKMYLAAEKKIIARW